MALMRHAARAVPWRIVGAGCSAVPALIALAAVRPEALRPGRERRHALEQVLALVRPVPERLPLFPIWDFEEWALSAAIWWAVLAGALGLLVIALTGGRAARGRARA